MSNMRNIGLFTPNAQVESLFTLKTVADCKFQCEKDELLSIQKNDPNKKQQYPIYYFQTENEKKILEIRLATKPVSFSDLEILVAKLKAPKLGTMQGDGYEFICLAEDHDDIYSTELFNIKILDMLFKLTAVVKSSRKGVNATSSSPEDEEKNSNKVKSGATKPDSFYIESTPTNSESSPYLELSSSASSTTEGSLLPIVRFRSVGQ